MSVILNAISLLRLLAGSEKQFAGRALLHDGCRGGPATGERVSGLYMF